MMAHRSSLLAIALVSSACSVEQTATRSQPIIGGDASEPSEFMATGMLVARGRLICTATLIAPDVALTAAHCLVPPVFGEFGFTLDTDAADGTDNVVPVRFTHQHPDFNDNVDDFVDLGIRADIGVLILEHPVLDVLLERLDEPGETALDPGNMLAVCGYGWEVWNTGGLPRKRDAMVAVDRSEDFEFSTSVADPQPCSGDSGAPLFLQTATGRRLVGIVSRAMGRSNMCNTGAIVTRIAPYTAWIKAASDDRDAGCSAGGGGSILPVGALGAVFALRAGRRRRTPR